MKKIIISLLLILSVSKIIAQQLPIFSNYIFDPYLYNPAFVGSNDVTEFNLIHRQQWVDIQNSPVTYGANAQIKLNPRMSIGINLINDETILLSRTSGLLTYGYKVPLGNNHALGFGLSLGAFYNQLNLDDLEAINDPALLNAEVNNFNIDGQFGFYYQNKGFKLGFALPRLFKTDPFIDTSFDEIEYSELANRIITGSYFLELGPLLNVMPFAHYRMTEDRADFFEAGGLFGYKNILKLGGFYRQDVGPGALFQISIKDKFDISYAYEYASAQNLAYSGATHEFQFKIRLAKKIKARPRKEPIKKYTDEKQVIDQAPTIKEQNIEPKTDSIEDTYTKSIVSKTEINDNITQDNTENEIVTPQEFEPTIKGYYVVVGSFALESNAKGFLNKVIKDYPESKLGYNKEKEYHFVYIYTIQPSEKSIETVERIRRETGFSDTWFMEIKD
ncbi:PorP/SprF family type IX secretion system membrane protein [Fulvivirga lutimaris]|uniref:PorP/SprF family type IX secretion system membrane protein n=1 Tax=Fulvivirga lutimaris TaxID=1819566 RepID=UPI0012BB85EB|nr:PorP/SprF family type IX secretion system membrane protein [Fulvivirga lutimaris]MTI38889.1 type IX secretion system membrane protein PorP/SprF [Fulvivirga lutimaris]